MYQFRLVFSFSLFLTLATWLDLQSWPLLWSLAAYPYHGCPGILGEEMRNVDGSGSYPLAQVAGLGKQRQAKRYRILRGVLQDGGVRVGMDMARTMRRRNGRGTLLVLLCFLATTDIGRRMMVGVGVLCVCGSLRWTREQGGLCSKADAW